MNCFTILWKVAFVLSLVKSMLNVLRAKIEIIVVVFVIIIIIKFVSESEVTIIITEAFVKLVSVDCIAVFLNLWNCVKLRPVVSFSYW